MIVEAAIAFVLIFICTYAIYALGKRSAPKTTISENEQASYACGERATFHGLKINVSLYKYLIYFVIFDSAVLSPCFCFFRFSRHKSASVILVSRHDSCSRLWFFSKEAKNNV